MLTPQIELTPRRPAVCHDATVTLDLLVRITPPKPEGSPRRPPLNLGLVIDRSGSMGEARKIDYARQAAHLLVEQLLPEDRVSITIFDHEVVTIAPNAPATRKPALLQAIAEIVPRGSTALHGGWAEGVAQVESNRIKEGLNRVLLLSDGLANQGLTDPNTIALEAKRASLRGVSTTTLGLGNDYNEDLLEAMARFGDGNYFYVESPVQLSAMFQTELQGLMATLGRGVRLAVEPAEGVVLSDVLNDLERLPEGELALPNLIAGIPILVFLRLSVPPRSEAGPLCSLRLSWESPEGETRRESQTHYAAPEVMPIEWWSAMPEDASVVEQEVLLMSARAQKEAAAAADRGDYGFTRYALLRTEQLIASSPVTPLTQEEMANLKGTIEALEARDYARMTKRAKHRSYQRSQSRPDPPEPPTS
ncbi:vWA domain-containing protein [Tautonia rosea]|uniref:vWA domain-containing protein n=1 Tax=Tautonia rosea TaxID=2728037 RepID=UPI001474BE1D|nr:VWA domain-containing protein [Tautonia rosea]